MANSSDSTFFPVLRRRAAYSRKKNGRYYRYQYYRREIAEDCLRRCVYCDCEEREIGGETSMELDHFRPKGLKQFECLTNDPRNLIYSCGCCNGLKSDWWPAAGTNETFVGAEGFIDPFDLDRREFYLIAKNGAIQGKRHPATYVIGLLALDRPFLRRLRESRMLKSELSGLVARLKEKAERFLAGHPDVDPKDICAQVLEVTARFELLISR
jgi:hypothetical protein